MPIAAYFLLHFVLYTIFRVAFLVWNWSGLESLGGLNLIYALLNGIRFDLAAIGATAGLMALAWVWIQPYQTARRIWLGTLIVMQTLMILLNFADCELVNFTGRRFSKSSLFLLGEGGTSNLIIPYLPMALFCFATIAVYIYFLVRIWKKPLFIRGHARRAAWTIGILIFSIIAFRGGIQNKPMTFVEARLFPEPLANQLILNSTFNLIKSSGKPKYERQTFMSQREMIAALDWPSVKIKPPASLKNVNVIIVIVESLSREYMELKSPEFTPYLNSLQAKGISFPMAYANGRRSIEGIGAILAGIPALMEEPFINSEFSANEFIGLGTALKAQGYSTSFFHGSKNGSMHFDSFAKSAGFDNYYGKSQYPNAAQDDDGTWGIFDEPFLQWTCATISEFKEPFLSAVFTLSSHQPFTIPESRKDKHPHGPHQYLQAMHYADYSIQQFMECAEKSAWGRNTLFVFTADHSGTSLEPHATFISKFEIPLIFYMADRKKIESLPVDQLAQQIDILPTILDAVGAKVKTKNLLSRSLWERGPKSVALYTDGLFDIVSTVTAPEEKQRQLEAIRQYFSQGLFDNKLYYPVMNK